MDPESRGRGPRPTRREFVRTLVAAPMALSGLQAVLVTGCREAENPPQGSFSFLEGLENVPDRSGSAPTDAVSVERCRSYEPAVLSAGLETALSRIGGLETLVRGKTVTVKLNLTGDGRLSMAGLPSGRTFQIHSGVVEVLCHLLAKAGARRVVLVESYFRAGRPEEILAQQGWSISSILSAGEHRVVFEDTRNRGAFSDYAVLAVPYGGYVFPQYHVNRRYEDTDVLISLAKLKNHNEAGITCASKNLFGVAPTALYGNDSPNEDSVQTRLAILHHAERPVPSGVTPERYPGSPGGTGDQDPPVSRYRVPRVTSDLASLRPVDLSVVDGIESVTGSAGPWYTGPEVQATRPGVLVAGTNPVTTDTVCAAIMGYNPDAGAGEHPFPGENHLSLLARAGTGSNDIRKIEIRGLGLSEALHEYQPDPEEAGWIHQYLRGG